MPEKASTASELKLTKQEIRIAREAAEYRQYMFLVFLSRGLSDEEAKRKAEEATDDQLAKRMAGIQLAKARKQGLLG